MKAYAYLFEQMVRRELRRKYKGSALGVVWYLVNPLVLAGAYALMFSLVLRYDAIEHYPLFLLLGIVVWVFFSQSLLAASGSLIEQGALIRKVRFPRETIPASVVATQLVIFAVLFSLLIPVALVVRGSLSPALALLPLIVAALGAFVLGLALAVAVLHAYFRDVAPILGAALLPWFFVTPIFFRPDDFPGLAARPWLGELLRWGNPVAPFIEAVRAVLYDGSAPGAGTLVYVVVAAVVALVAGRALFRRLEGELAVVL
ncbi:MAG: ABC transporter permease [Actinomycetota bacterium]|nr:ABC transporter permease [Actinomycetota bacterium]